MEYFNQWSCDKCCSQGIVAIDNLEGYQEYMRETLTEGDANDIRPCVYLCAKCLEEALRVALERGG